MNANAKDYSKFICPVSMLLAAILCVYGQLRLYTLECNLFSLSYILNHFTFRFVLKFGFPFFFQTYDAIFPFDRESSRGNNTPKKFNYTIEFVFHLKKKNQHHFFSILPTNIHIGNVLN